MSTRKLPPWRFDPLLIEVVEERAKLLSTPERRLRPRQVAEMALCAMFKYELISRGRDPEKLPYERLSEDSEND